MRNQKFFDFYEHEEWRKLIQYKLESIIKERKMSPHKLAIYSELSDSSISRYLSGGYVPSLRAACNMANALRVSPTYLFCPYDFSRQVLYEPNRSYAEDASDWPATLTTIKYHWLIVSSKRLEWLAQHYDLSQRKISKLIDVPQPMLSRYFNGKTEPSLENAIELLWLFDGIFEDVWYYNTIISG